MTPFTTLRGAAAPLKTGDALLANVDTDMIIPKQFLKTVTREGLKVGLFHEMKTNSDGTPNKEFVLNKPAYENASILIAGDNFGCGSSREHAPWAILDQGIRCVIAPSFADIFFNNCFKNGILPIALPQEICDKLAEQAGGGNHVFTVDLPNQKVTAPDGNEYAFDIDQGRKENLVAGLDEIGESMTHSVEIEAYENKRQIMTPWLERA
ncbi:3-isopropylmalate dehydratase small subunit [Hirschia maritima]|uniref:3-isopropylmalate dehydratase small subunit n=1 Tax=Hirschia maritima TaxID=1121961 RepID=UPI00036F62A0|nr:3-isopropylmalate dehydratase small subunit [Hirschia maritima]